MTDYIDPSRVINLGGHGGSEGFGGGYGLTILLLFALMNGRLGGLGGCGSAPLAAVGSCQDLLTLLNATNSVKDQVANTLAATISEINTVSDRVVAAGVASTSNINDKINTSSATLGSSIDGVKGLIAALASENSNRFFSVQREMDQNNFALQSNINGQFSNLNSYLCNAFNAQTQNFNSLSRQVSDSTCLLSKEIEKTQCMIGISEERVLRAISDSAKDQSLASRDQTIAALQAQICAIKESHSNDKVNQIIAVNSTLQSQIGTIASALSNALGK